MRARRTCLLSAALAVCSAALLAAAPDIPRDRSALAAVQAQLGDLLFREGRFRDAIEPYEVAFEHAADPLRGAVGQQLVKSLLRSAEFRRAHDAVLDVAALRPDDAEVKALEGDALWGIGLFDEAEAAYHAALAADADTPRARNGLARALLARGHYEEALEEAITAVRAEPNEPDWHHALGMIHQAQRRYPDAARAFGRYLSLLPYRDTSDTALWAAQQVRFLQSFGKRTPLRVRGDGDTQIHRVPFRVENDKIIVSARVNGSRDMPFVLDTGAELTVITRPVAERANVRADVYTLTAGVGHIGVRGVQKGRIDRLQIGTLEIEQVPTLIKSPPLVGMPRIEAESLNPLMLGFSLTIDYRNRVLTMARTLEEGSATAERLPVRLNRLALVRGVINRGSPAPFVVDTGGQVISISRSTASALQLRAPRHIPLKVYGVSGIDHDAFLMPGLELTFDRVQLKNTAVAVLNLDAPSALLGFELGGIVGHKFLSRYRVAIDLPRSELRLE